MAGKACGSKTCNCDKDFEVSSLIKDPDSATRTEVVLLADRHASAAIKDAKVYCDWTINNRLSANTQGVLAEVDARIKKADRDLRDDFTTEFVAVRERVDKIEATLFPPKSSVPGNNSVQGNTFKAQSQEEIDAEVARNQARQVDIKASKVVLPGEKPFKCTCPACVAWRAMNDAALLSPIGPPFFDSSKVGPLATDAIKNGRSAGTMDVHEDLERKLAATTRRAEIAEGNAANSARASSERRLTIASLRAQLDGVLAINGQLNRQLEDVRVLRKEALAKCDALQARNDRQAESIRKQANKLREMGVEVPLPGMEEA